MKDTSERTGPGTVSARFDWLLDELGKRFPAAVNKFDSTTAPETRYLATIDALKSILSARDNPPDPVTFSVSIATMQEAHRTTYHVLLRRSDVWSHASPFSDDGVMSVFDTENYEHANIEAEDWRTFVAGITTPTQSVAKSKEPSTDSEVLQRVKEAIHDLHHAYDLRQHGDVAAHSALSKIEHVLGMNWVQGVEKTRRETMGNYSFQEFTIPPLIKKS